MKAARADPLAWWQAAFGDVPPRGHLLRPALADRWVRFHSLPQPPRHADSEAEHAEIQARHLAVAASLFDAREPLYVYRSHTLERRLRGKARHRVAGRQLRDAVVRLPAVPSQDLDEDDQMNVRALVTTWKPDFFEASVRLLADWEEVGVAFVSPATRNIFCPYDGGMDVFVHSTTPAALRTRFAAWLPTTPSGL